MAACHTGSCSKRSYVIIFLPSGRASLKSAIGHLKSEISIPTTFNPWFRSRLSIMSFRNLPNRADGDFASMPLAQLVGRLSDPKFRLLDFILLSGIVDRGHFNLHRVSLLFLAD